MTQKEYRKLSTLKNWDKNPRSIKEKDFERLKTHIRDFGQMQPLVITPDGTVLGGNMRLRAYNALGMDDIWVQVVEPKDEDDKLRIALILNDRAGYYDGDLLANLTGEYPDFNWEDYAVDLKEPQTLDEILDQYKEVEEDDVPEVSSEPAVSKLGEVYQLGRHRLMCGDATKIEDVEKLMNGQKADMVFTDPPYNVAIKGKFTGAIKNDDLSEDDFNELLDLSFTNLALYNKGSSYICYEIKLQSLSEPYVVKIGAIDEIIIWNKDSASFYSKNKYNRKFEAMFFVKGNGLLDCDSETNVWDFPKSSSFNSNDENGKKFNQAGNFLVAHPTTKPTALIARALKNSSKQDDIVLDLFGGSGSTLIACEQTNRTCYMMELDPKYCDVIRKRYENFTKK